MVCPCGSGKKIEVCCASIIENHAAQTAEELMRSRYTAYKQHNALYLLETTHTKTRNKHSLEGILQWAKENDWQKLQILNSEHGTNTDQEGIVEFKAYYKDAKGRNQMHHERSVFLKEGENWFYLEGEIDPLSVPISENKINRNEPCPCGSGKKYKKCCA